MDQSFLKRIYEKHQNTEAVPSTKDISSWAIKVIRLLYPEQAKEFFRSVDEIEGEFWNLGNELKHLLETTDQCKNCNINEKVNVFNNSIPELFRLLNTDVDAILEGDPAAKSKFEIVRAYPGFYAISIYRLANLLHKLEVNLIPRILTEFAHSRTGIDIHPGAEIGEYFFIDHGTGVVIGETCIIGNHVKIYQGVTLGALSVDKALANTKRHPTVKDNVVIYSGATILGGNTTIGENSVIGGNVWLTKSVPANSTVYHKPEIKVVENEAV
ncbi:serine acetyltransferase [Lacihabitans sp. CCS-44]|uniref:serine O-acetyltransferase EpsC n=1 Tax=Lacihabitans sp. CCS-44 TaxID=2487331 RepID=UPI0020CEC6DB|nr:serine O-acetyltransferase EpsC [Lacihabitans sp. CCS-44]MCP9756175.1 serine acetyltransferase [Lacihabitans sp. CCS-44]